MKTRVYVETSVLSHLAARPSRDPIVEEIHEIRRKIMEECGNDPRRYFARLKAAEVRERDHPVLKAPRRKRRTVEGK